MYFLSQFDALHEQAIQAAGGLNDFGSDDYREPLRLLLSAYDKCTRFGEMGKQIMMGSIAADLASRLHEEEGFKRFPQYANALISKPLIVTGMARTGTTVLHRLIAQDPAMQTLPLWLSATPMPRPARAQWESYPGYQQIQKALDQQYQMSPQMKQFHPQSAAAPDECRYLLNHSFWSPTNATLFNVPEYAAWASNADVRYAYRRHRRTLGLIAGENDRRWLLKCPTHLWALPALLDIYPDACIVVTHRDPVESITSIISLSYNFCKLVEPGLAPDQYGKECMGRWCAVPNKAELDRASIDPSRIFDIHCDDIKSDPMGSLARIYQYFDIPASDEARASWQKLVRDDPNGGHAAHHFTPEQFGFSADDIRARIGSYYERYDHIAKATS